jgi:glycosyltransferase involved in cell wall biosynthesis
VTNGFGLIVANTLAALAATPGVEPRLIALESEDSHANLAQSARLRIEEIPQRLIRRRPLTRFDLARAVVRGPLATAERDFLEAVRRESRQADAAIWFGSSWDVLTPRIPAACACPAIHHANDSISLFELRRGGAAAVRRRAALAALVERRAMRAGFRSIVYVAGDDAARARGLAAGSAAAIHVLPNGVDTGYFTARPRACNPRPVLLFSGVLGYLPNVATARYIVSSVLPHVREEVVVRIAGRNPAPEVRALAADPRVTVAAGVEDIAREYQSADIFLAPMQGGGGCKNKLLEAAACGLPIVTNPLGASGFPAAAPFLFVGRRPEQIAGLVARLCADARLRQEAGAAGADFVARHCSWTARTANLLAAAC